MKDATVGNRATRWLWLSLAYVSLGLALVGIAVPLLPTVPFALLAAFAAARGSEALHRRLLAHRSLGPVIRDWEESRAVGRGPKRLAVRMMAVSLLVLVLVAPSRWVTLGVGVLMAAVAIWLWRRPEPAATEVDEGV